MRFAAVANHHGARLRHAIVSMSGDLSCQARLDPCLDMRVIASEARPGDPLGNLARFRRILREARPDVLLTHNWGAIEWALANAPPGLPMLTRHVHVEDGFGPEERSRQLPRRVWMRRLALRRATVALPSAVLAGIARDIWRLDGKRVAHVPNGVDLARFARAAPSPAAPPWTPGPGPVIGTVAGLRPEKNVGRLLAAFARLPGEPMLVVIGDGPDRAALAARAEGLGIADRARFVGHLTDPALAYPHFDVFALSSDTEQMPLSVLEAMAASLPVASTDVGDVADMVAAENRPFVVTDRADGQVLAGALAGLLDDSERRRAIGAANRTRAERVFGEDAMFAAWGALLAWHDAPAIIERSLP